MKTGIFHLDLKIGSRVALAFCLVLATTVASVAAVQVSLRMSARNAAMMIESAADQARTAQIHLLAKDNAIAAMMSLIASSTDLQARLKREIQDREAQIESGLDALQARQVRDSDTGKMLVEARKRHTTYRAGVSRILDLVLAGKQAEASFAADEEMIPMLGPFLKGLEQLDAATHQQLQEAEAANTSLIARTQAISAAAGVAAAVIAALAGVWLVLSITRPLTRAMGFAERVAAGDLGSRMEAEGRDEISMLLRTLNKMTENLARMVSLVRDSSDTIATGSAEIANGNLDLSHRTEVQAGALEETAATMEELNAAARQNASHAKQAAELAARACEVASRGGQVVGEVVATMKGINDSSKQITDIVSVIDGIAFQTNILALNAAVEAARAGEQGRGFAVVAGEVRSLAGRSAEAARQIKQLIATSVERVERGATLVDRAGTTMSEVVQSIQSVTTLMGELSTAGTQQSAGFAQVGEAVSQMDQVTQQNAALVEESAAAAESLKHQADALTRAVAVFSLSGERR